MAILLLPPTWTAPCQQVFRRIFRTPLRAGRSLPTLSAVPRVATVADPVLTTRLQTLETENRQLRHHVANLEAQLADEVARLSRLARVRLRPGWERVALVPAEVVTAPTPTHLTLNRGTHDGLQRGLFVIQDNAVVGQLADVRSWESHLRLVTDPDCSLPVAILARDADPNGMQRIVGKLDGAGTPQPHLRVNSRRPVRVGDPVHALGQSGIDIPLLVGHVASCRRDKEEPWLWDVLVEPAGDLRDLREVCILRPGP